MATSRRRKSIIATLVRTDERGAEVHVPGAEMLVAAFNDRNADVLKAVLQQHPEAWKTEMPWYAGKAPRRAEYCMAVKMAVALNWAPGLDILVDHGADPNKRFELSETTALDLAVRLARPAMVKRLLRAKSRFSNATPSSSIRQMFAKEFSRARIEKCWKVVSVLSAHNMPIWTIGSKPPRGNADVLLGLLNCYLHPDGGVAQALHLLEKFPVPAPHRAEVAAAMTVNLGRAAQLWERTHNGYDADQVAKLFDAMAAQEILPDPAAFVSAAVDRWDMDESKAPAVRSWIQEMLLMRLPECDPAAAADILREFGEHACLAGAGSAVLSSLAMQATDQSEQTAVRAPRL